MAAWVDLAALHNPAQGLRPPASWGDGINSNMNFLAGAAAAEILTSESTSSASYVNLATTGPTVTVDTGTKAVAFVQAQIGSASGDTRMSVAVSGASSIAANDDEILWMANIPAGGMACSAMLLWTTLTAGTNIFTCKYYTAGGGAATWLRRRLLVIPLV